MDKIAMYKEEIYKIAEEAKEKVKKDKGPRTKFWKDRVLPEMMASGPAAAVGALAGKGLMFGKPSVNKYIRAGALGAAAGYGTRAAINTKRVDDLKQRHMGEKATFDDKLKSLIAVPGAFTPESIVKKQMRNNARGKSNF